MWVVLYVIELTDFCYRTGRRRLPALQSTLFSEVMNWDDPVIVELFSVPICLFIAEY